MSTPYKEPYTKDLIFPEIKWTIKRGLVKLAPSAQLAKDKEDE